MGDGCYRIDGIKQSGLGNHVVSDGERRTDNVFAVVELHAGVTLGVMCYQTVHVCFREVVLHF